MFDELVARLRRRQAEFDFELARCEDAYRLKYLLERYGLDIMALNADASEMVRELEDA